jgi:uncharacterized protein with FMN-binding domain
MRRVIVAITSTIVGLVLLLSFKTESGATLAARPVISRPVISTGSTTVPTTAASSAAPNSSTPNSSGTKTVTGDAVDTRYGPVQVQVVAKNGVITSVQALEFPQNTGRDIQINNYAIPALNQEAQQADSANIDMISGATYTSTGYIQSLQSALDQLK